MAFYRSLCNPGYITVCLLEFMSSFGFSLTEQDAAVSSVPYQGSHPCQQLHRHTQECQPFSRPDRALLLPALQASPWEVLCRPPGCLFQGTLGSCLSVCLWHFYHFLSNEAFSHGPFPSSISTLSLWSTVSRRAEWSASLFPICSKSSRRVPRGSSIPFNVVLKVTLPLWAHPKAGDEVKTDGNRWQHV